MRSLDLNGRPVPAISWAAAAPPDDRPVLRRWRRGVGPVRVAFEVGSSAPGDRPEKPNRATRGAKSEPVDRRAAPSGTGSQLPLTVASWNAQCGGGALRGFWRYLRERSAGPVVVLLQEVFSGDAHVPQLAPGSAWAPRISARPRDEGRTCIVSFARDRGLSLLYVPSMRNGRPGGGTPEDRGNAILANVPLSSPRAVELPFERQRRVAVTAKATLGALAVTFCSLHLDNRAPWRRAWRSLGRSRRRQMRGLLSTLPADGQEEALVLGGDFNTWVLGRREAAYKLARERCPRPRDPDPQPTHHFEIGGWLRPSDHLLFRLPSAWRCEYRRLDRTFGSDHYPLVGTLDRGR